MPFSVALAVTRLSTLPLQVQPAKPDSSQVPGGSVLQGLVSGALYLALLACTIGLVISGASLALGNRSSNPHMAERGKHGLVGSIVGAIIVGGAIAIINFFAGKGAGI